MFGYKQKGKASVQAINVFHPAVSTPCASLHLYKVGPERLKLRLLYNTQVIKENWQ